MEIETALQRKPSSNAAACVRDRSVPRRETETKRRRDEGVTERVGTRVG